MAEVEITKRETTIDGDTVEKQVAGVVKGFGKGLLSYLEKGQTPAVSADLEVVVGIRNGKYAVQLMISPFDREDDATTVADRLTRVVNDALRNGV